MKYTKFIGLAALVMAFTACDDIEESNSLPQVNPQLPGVSADNVKVVAGSDAQAPISLTAFNTVDGLVNIAKVDTPTDWPEGYTPNVPFMQMSQTQDFTDVKEVPTSMGAEGEVLVNPDEWDGVWKEAYGKNPKERTIYLRFPVFAVKGTQSVRMGNASTFYGAESVKVTPFNIYDHVIEDAYYIVGSFCNWDPSKAIKMTHSEYDPYDDPNFSATITVDGAGYEWAVIPESTVGTGNINAGGYGGEYPGITDAEGFLVAAEAGQAPNSIVIDRPGPYQININMIDLSYSYSAAAPFLYTPGNTNGWNQGASQTLDTSNYTWYRGFAHLNGEFKISTQADWNGVNSGQALDADGNVVADKLAIKNIVGGEEKDAPNIVAPEDALYYMTADLENMAYKLNAITALGVIGDATPAGWDGQTNLTPSADFLTWSGVIEMKDGEFKFRMNDNWDINLGGDLADLTVDGANMRVAAGKYLVTLNLAARPYVCTLTPQ